MLADLGPGLRVPVGPAPVRLVSGLHVPRPVGIVGACPAPFVVPGVAQRVEQPLVARGRDIERTAARQLHTGRQRMDVRRPVGLAVQDGTGGVLVGLQAGKRRGLPLVEDLGDLLVTRLVLRRPRDDAGRIPPLVRAAVGDLGDQVRVAAQYRDLGAFLAPMVTILEQIPHSAAGAALAVAQELDVHGSTSWPWSSGSYRGSSASRCSSRWIAASSASR